MTDFRTNHGLHVLHKLVFQDCPDCQRHRPPAADLTLLGRPRKRPRRSDDELAEARRVRRNADRAGARRRHRKDVQ